MEYVKVKKVTFFINTMILAFVIGLWGFFALCKATFLVYYSIPTALVYIIGYFIISKEKLYFYVNLIYIWITVYMGVTTVCLGYNYGFHLYSMSLIPICFYTQYISHKINKETVNAMGFAIFIVIVNLGSSIYSIWNGPIYKTSTFYHEIFFVSNSLMVFGLVIFYTKYLVKSNIESQDNLERMAHIDRLTGLYNRHFMIDELSKTNTTHDHFVAMIDIDDFKKINDMYGHNAGDYVLCELSAIMKNVCERCVVSRWGGEEFLVLNGDAIDEKNLFETLRKEVETHDFIYEKIKIPVSITIGVSKRETKDTIDEWIKKADSKLYEGKRSGKNKVVL